jgi:hypothetical protein
MSRKLCITAVDGQTGYLIAKLLLTSGQFSNKIDTITGLSLDRQSPNGKALSKLGVDIIHHVHGTEKKMVGILKTKSNADTICIASPTHLDKYQITPRAYCRNQEGWCAKYLLAELRGG